MVDPVHRRHHARPRRNVVRRSGRRHARRQAPLSLLEPVGGREAAARCVAPGAARTDCELGDNNLYVEYVQNGGDATSAAYCADAGAKPSCGTIASAGGATADCSASMNGVTSSYTAGADNCGTSAAIRVTNNCYAGVCQ